jgi:hypothetical protein
VIVAGESGHVTLPSASVQPRSVVLLVTSSGGAEIIIGQRGQVIDAGAAVEAARRIVELESKPQQEIDLGQYDCRTREHLYLTAL